MISLRWIDHPDELDRVGAFLAQVIATDPAYISHGEIQTGLSEDGVSWSPKLPERMAEDLRALDEERSVAGAYHAEAGLVAAAIVAWTQTDRVRFATIEDLAVATDWRSQGLGAQLMAFIDAAARDRGAQWLFLESGLHNEHAHTFFQRGGFQPISKVFVKRMGD